MAGSHHLLGAYFLAERLHAEKQHEEHRANVDAAGFNGSYGQEQKAVEHSVVLEVPALRRMVSDCSTDPWQGKVKDTKLKLAADRVPQTLLG